MPTKTPFDPLPTKTRLPADPPTKTVLPVESSATPVGLPTATRTIEHEPLPTAPRVLVHRTTTPTATASSTAVATRRATSTATPLPPVSVTFTASPTIVRRLNDLPQPIVRPIFITTPSPDSGAPLVGVISLVGLIGLALLVQYHRWARTDLRLRRATLQLTRHTQLIIDNEWIFTRLNQSVFDAAGQDIGLDQIERVVSDPPAIIGLGRDFQRVIFTPVPIHTRALIPLLDGSPRRLRAYPINARCRDLFIVDDLVAAHQYLCQQRHVAPPLSARLTHCDRWLIYLLPPPDSHSQRR